MRNPGGALLVTLEDGREYARDTYSCNHCNAVVVVEPGDVPAGLCLVCHKHVCAACLAVMNRTLRCVPFEAKIEAMERRDRLRAAAAVA